MSRDLLHPGHEFREKGVELDDIPDDERSQVATETEAEDDDDDDDDDDESSVEILPHSGDEAEAEGFGGGEQEEGRGDAAQEVSMVGSAAEVPVVV
jgi:hypothetical protein